MPIEYEYAGKVTGEEIFDLLKRMEKGTGDRFPANAVFHIPLRTLEKEQQSIDNSLSIVARDEGGRLVGYARVMTDYTYVYYITDVMVDPDMQGLGIGRGLMDVCIEECKKGGFIKILLTAIPDKVGFYEKLNFKPVMSPVMALRGEDYVVDEE